MARRRRKFTPDFKAKVALEALKERSSLNELAHKYGLQPTQISKWKRELREHSPQAFTNDGTQDLRRQEARESKLYEEIGRLKVQLDWLKKKTGSFD